MVYRIIKARMSDESHETFSLHSKRYSKKDVALRAESTADSFDCDVAIKL